MKIIDRDKWRQKLRNPSVPFVVTVTLLFFLVLIAVVGPFAYRRGKIGYTELRKLDVQQFRDPPETWIRPWLVMRIDRMIDAQEVIQWYPSDFAHEACAEDWIEVLPQEKYQNAVRSTCKDLRRIQAEYAWACTVESCKVPEVARAELSEVKRKLNEAYEGALFTPVAGG